MKRPAAAAEKDKAVPKAVPKAAHVYVKPKAVPWDESDNARDRNTFTSLWYDRTKRSLNKTSGWSEGAVKAELKRVFAMAGTTHDKNAR